MIRVTTPKWENPRHKGKRKILLQIGKYQFYLANFEVNYLIQSLKETLSKVERREQEATK